MEIQLKLESPWRDVKEKLKEINLSLTDNDLEYIPGHEEELLERVGKKLGRSIGEIKAWIESVSFNKGKAG